MIIGVIIVGVLIFALMILVSWTYINKRYGSNFGVGMFIGGFMTILMVIEIRSVSMIIEKPTPLALDVYRGNTELEITSVNGTLIDTVVVFKKNND